MSMFTLYRNTEIICQEASYRPVEIAANNVKRDLMEILTESGSSRIELKTDSSIPEELYRRETTEDGITIFSSDYFGWIYAMYDISRECLGMQPMWFWNDQAIEKKTVAQVPCGTVCSSPCRVRYRGWFINDQQLLEGWIETYQSEEYVWSRIYETVMRLGGNMMITHSQHDMALALQLLADYGMYLSYTHNNPLGAESFSSRWPGLQASYARYPEKFEQLWREAVQRQKGMKVIWTVGYRGQGDCAFWQDDPSFDTDEKRGGMIGQVIRRQMEIVREYVKNPVFCTNLYGEMTELYRKGDLAIPREVIKVWGDSGYGRMVSRRQGNLDPRADAMPEKGTGRNGIYYHASFHDLQASNHITMSPNSAEFLTKELIACFDNGGDDYLIINCGSVKPHIYPLDLMAELWRKGKVDVKMHAQTYASAYYGPHADRIADLLTRFSQLAPQYGIHADEHAGEQFYHYNARYIMQALMAGRTEEPLDVIIWLGGNAGIRRQVEKIQKICENAFSASDAYLTECKALLQELEGNEKDLFEATVWVQAVIHNTGLHGLYHICRAFSEKCDGFGSRAFVHAYEVGKFYSEGLNWMHRTERGKWEGIYREDCLTNVELTCYVSNALRSWLRICEEGEYFTGWEKEYLADKNDPRIIGSFNTNKALPDDTLAEGMKAKYGELKAGSRFAILKRAVK